MWNEFFPISMPTTAIALCSGIVLRDGKVVVPMSSLPGAGLVVPIQTTEARFSFVLRTPGLKHSLASRLRRHQRPNAEGRQGRTDRVYGKMPPAQMIVQIT